MNTATIAPPAESMLGQVTGGLCLRVIGAPAAIPPISLAAAKCTIGSGPGCTLRVKGRGIEPVACLVIRGARGMVVRNWSGRAHLNGRWFVDAPLHVGDRLDLGGVAFEVTAPPSGPAPRSLAETLTEETAEQLSRLLEITERLEAERGRTAAENAALRQEQDAAVAELSRLKAERESWEARLADERQALEARSGRWEQEQAAWAERRQAENLEIAAERNELTRRFTDLTIRADELSVGREDLKRRQQKIEEQVQKLAGQSAGLIAAEEQLRLETTRQLESQATSQESLRSVETETATSRAALDLAHQQVEAERARLDARAHGLADREARVAEHQAKLDDAQATCAARLQQINARAERLTDAETALESLRQEVASQRAALDEAVATLADERASLKAQRGSLADERHQSDRAAEEATSTLTAQVVELQAALTSLEQQLQVCETDRLELEARLEQESVASHERELRTAERQAALEAEQQALAAAKSQLEAERERLAEESRQLGADRAELASLREQLATERDAIAARNLNEVRERARPGEGDPPAPDDRAGDESADEDRIFERLNQMAHGDAERPAEPADPTQTGAEEAGAESANEPDVRVSDAYARFQQRMREEEQAEALAPVAKVAAVAIPHAGDEEESIEDYMARLMCRVRGETNEPSVPPIQPARRQASSPKPAAAPKPADEEYEAPSVALAAPPAGEAPAVSTGPVELVARAQAPEVNELSRMRELANSQARAAIDKFTRSRTASEITNKWAIVAIGIIMSGAMAFMGWHGNRIALLGMCAGLTMSFYYAVRATWSTKGMFAGRKEKKRR